MFLVDPQADVRRLIVAADVTVGLSEHSAARGDAGGPARSVHGWDETATALGDELIPFHEWGPRSPSSARPRESADAVAAARGQTCATGVLSGRREIAERYLGPLDGLAADRTVAVLREEAELWAARRGPGEQALRERLGRRRRPAAHRPTRAHAVADGAAPSGAMLGR